MSLDMPEKTTENRLRRKAARLGFKLIKSRTREEQAVDYGKYLVVNAYSKAVVAQWLNLKEVQTVLDAAAVSDSIFAEMSNFGGPS
jgi:hypothetical protein